MRLVNYLQSGYRGQYPCREEDVGERGPHLYPARPAVRRQKFSPAIIGNGTQHKYLLYCDEQLPLYPSEPGVPEPGQVLFGQPRRRGHHHHDQSQGSYVKSDVTYPTGLTEVSADDLHTAVYQSGSLEGNAINKDRFVDNYTSVLTNKANPSRMGYSFTIGIIAVALAYLLGVPLGILVALKKDKLVDKIGTAYIVFIMAVPSLSYILIFKAIGNGLGLPTTFDHGIQEQAHVRPAHHLPGAALHRRTDALAAPLHDRPDELRLREVRPVRRPERGRDLLQAHPEERGDPHRPRHPRLVLGALVGAFITERVYVVPGIGGLLINAINAYDNGVIVGVTLFYATISVVSMILGDVLMSMVDPPYHLYSESEVSRMESGTERVLRRYRHDR